MGRAISLKLMCPPQGKTLLLAFTDPWMIYTCAVTLSVCVCVCVFSFFACSQQGELYGWSFVGNGSESAYIRRHIILVSQLLMFVSMNICMCNPVLCIPHAFMSVIILFSELLLAHLLLECHLLLCPVRWT